MTRTRTRTRLAVFVAAGLLVALALAFFVSPQASSQPDGLNKVAGDQGFADQTTTHQVAQDSPLAGYGDGGGMSTGVAGVIGVTVTFALAGGFVLLVRRRSRGTA